MGKIGEVRARIEALNPSLNAFVAVIPAPRPIEGPLTGLSVGVKDCFYDGGRVPTMGSLVHPGPWGGTAEILRRLRASGTDLIGYTNLHEWAIGGTSAVTATGPIHNPWDLALVAGGSSGGSAAALAAGLVDMAIGTDTGGSIRIPAACCGVVGLKPTQGRVPTAGYAGEGGPTDQIGPMARSVAVTRTLFECLVDEKMDPVDVSSLRIGVARGEAFENIQPEVGGAYATALETISKLAPTRDVEIHGWDEQWWANAALFINYSASLVAGDLGARPGSFQPDALKVLRWGLGLPDDLIAEQHRLKKRAKQRWAEMFENIDVLVSPTLPSLPPAIADLKVRLPSDVSEADVAFGRLCGPMNLVGVPCLSLPGGSAGDLTVNISMTAAPGRDHVVLALGEAFEDATDRVFTNRIAEIRDAG